MAPQRLALLTPTNRNAWFRVLGMVRFVDHCLFRCPNMAPKFTIVSSECDHVRAPQIQFNAEFSPRASGHVLDTPRWPILLKYCALWKLCIVNLNICNLNYTWNPILQISILHNIASCVLQMFIVQPASMFSCLIHDDTSVLTDT